MKILITGNMGYVGPCVVRHLRRARPDAALVGLDLGFFAHCLTGADQLPELRLDCQVFGDVRAVPSEYLRDVDAIVHLAAVSNDPMGKKYEAVTDEINNLASVRLAAQAKHAGVRRFVFASSCSVYGFSETDARSERSELNPLTAYARSKIDAEHGLEALGGDGFTVTCLRFPTACGMSDRLRLDLVLNDFVAAAFCEGRIKVLSDGTPWRPLIDVEDMARAIDWALGREPSEGGDYAYLNAGRTDWNYQVRDLAEAVHEQFPKADISINRDAPADKRSYRVDFARYRELAPRHQPRIDLAQSIERLSAGLEKLQTRHGRIEAARYIRLNVLAELQARNMISDTLAWTNGWT